MKVDYFFVLFSLKRLSAVPSFFRCVVVAAVLVLAASLFALKRMSAVPSFFVVEACVTGFLGVVWAKLAQVKVNRREKASRILFMISILIYNR